LINIYNNFSERERKMKNVLLFFSILVCFLGTTSAQNNTPKFSGYMFGDYYYVADSHDSTLKDLNGFQFRRIYITTDYSISDKFVSRFRLEADQGNGSLTAGNKIGVMVKDAWLKWKNIFDGSDLVFGLSPTPAYDVSEAVWEHRYLEKTIMDFYGIVPSRDLGIDLKGKFDHKGTVKYWAKIGNNSGNSPEVNKYKRFYGLLEFNPIPEFLFTIYGDYASYPKVADPVSSDMKDNSAFVGAAFLNYNQKGSFSLGAEGFIKSQQNNTVNSDNTALETQNGFGVSIWGYVNFTKTIQLVGRFDTIDPNTNLNNDGKNMILGGVQFNPDENVSISPNIEVFTYQKDGVNNDVVPRITFFWKF
jgi:hypothetical protein